MSRLTLELLSKKSVIVDQCLCLDFLDCSSGNRGENQEKRKLRKNKKEQENRGKTIKKPLLKIVLYRFQYFVIQTKGV